MYRSLKIDLRVWHCCLYLSHDNNNFRYFFYLQVASSSKTWGSKPTCPEEELKGITVKSQMRPIK